MENMLSTELTLYYGNCSKFMLFKMYLVDGLHQLVHIKYDLPIGYYTVVETRTPSGYQTAEKD